MRRQRAPQLVADRAASASQSAPDPNVPVPSDLPSAKSCCRLQGQPSCGPTPLEVRQETGASSASAGLDTSGLPLGECGTPMHGAGGEAQPAGRGKGRPRSVLLWATSGLLVFDNKPTDAMIKQAHALVRALHQRWLHDACGTQALAAVFGLCGWQVTARRRRFEARDADAAKLGGNPVEWVDLGGELPQHCFRKLQCCYCEF